MCTRAETDLNALAEEILRYLRAHGSAADTARGIARWWIKRQRLDDALHRVQSALDLLVARAALDAYPIRGGDTLYRLHRNRPDAQENG